MNSFISRFHYVFFLAAAAILFSGCKGRTGDKIPFDEQRARQHIIPIQQGSQYSVNFVNVRDSVLPRLIRDSLFLEQRFNLPIAETFNRDAIIALLNVDSCDGVRVYFGNDEKGLVRLVLMPVDKGGKDIITLLTGSVTNNAAGQVSKAAISGESVENGQRPPPPSSPLNTDATEQ